jgi:hypothetical protein
MPIAAAAAAAAASSSVRKMMGPCQFGIASYTRRLPFPFLLHSLQRLASKERKRLASKEKERKRLASREKVKEGRGCRVVGAGTEKGGAWTALFFFFFFLLLSQDTDSPKMSLLLHAKANMTMGARLMSSGLCI